jgi:hypothetical protein
MSSTWRVMRTKTISHAAREVVWQVMTRPLRSKEEADSWCDFLQAEYNSNHPNGKHRFFVIEVHDYDHDLPHTIPTVTS